MTTNSSTFSLSQNQALNMNTNSCNNNNNINNNSWMNNLIDYSTTTTTITATKNSSTYLNDKTTRTVSDGKVYRQLFEAQVYK